MYFTVFVSPTVESKIAHSKFDAFSYSTNIQPIPIPCLPNLAAEPSTGVTVLYIKHTPEGKGTNKPRQKLSLCEPNDHNL
jgi:hypothetical protein